MEFELRVEGRETMKMIIDKVDSGVSSDNACRIMRYHARVYFLRKQLIQVGSSGAMSFHHPGMTYSEVSDSNRHQLASVKRAIMESSTTDDGVFSLVHRLNREITVSHSRACRTAPDPNLLSHPLYRKR
jgi:hypothetical protein